MPLSEIYFAERKKQEKDITYGGILHAEIQALFYAMQELEKRVSELENERPMPNVRQTHETQT